MSDASCRAPNTAWQVLALLAILYAGLRSVAYLAIWLRLEGNDFGKFYYAIQQWQAGGSLYGQSPATQPLSLGDSRVFLNMNPPHLHWLIWPFAQLDLPSAAAAWLVLNVVAGLLCAYWVIRELALPVPARLILPALAFVLGCAATSTILITGQMTPLLLVPFTQAWLAARRGRWLAAGAWLGAVIAVKPFFGPFVLYLLVRREMRGLAALMGIVALSFGAGIAWFGWPEHARWFEAMRSVDWSWAAMNASLPGFATRLFSVSPYYAPIVLAPTLMRVVEVLAVVSVTAVTALALRKARVDDAFALLTLGSLLISPLGWIYYLWLALGPCLAVWQRTCYWPPLVIAGIALLVPLEHVAPTRHPVITLTLGSAYMWALLALWSSVLLAAIETPEVPSHA